MTSCMQTMKALIVATDLNKEVNSESFKSGGDTKLFCLVKCPTNGEELQKDITKLCKKKFGIKKAPGKIMENSLLSATKYKDIASGLGSSRAADFWRALSGALFYMLQHHLLPHGFTAAC